MGAAAEYYESHPLHVVASIPTRRPSLQALPITERITTSEKPETTAELARRVAEQIDGLVEKAGGHHAVNTDHSQYFFGHSENSVVVGEASYLPMGGGMYIHTEQLHATIMADTERAIFGSKKFVRTGNGVVGLEGNLLDDPLNTAARMRYLLTNAGAFLEQNPKSASRLDYPLELPGQ